MDKDLKAVHERALKRFAKSEEFEAEDRKEALEDLRFGKLGDQWPEKIRAERESESRPCLTINRIPAFARQVVNDSRINKPQIKCHPIDDKADPKTAEILNGVIRNIEVSSNSDIAYDTAIDSAVYTGKGYFRVNVEYASDDSFDYDIVLDRIINRFSVYEDSDSVEGDGSDWRYCFVTQWYEPDEFEREFPDAEKINFESASTGDKNQLWFEDGKIRVAEYWERVEVEKTLHQLNNGQVVDDETYQEQAELFAMAGLSVVASKPSKSYKVTQYWINGIEVIEQSEWQGRYIPIVPVYGDEVNVEGKRYYMSLFRQAKDAQRMFNYWRTTSTELVALSPKAPFIGPVGAFDVDAEKWATANVKTHAYIQYDGDIPPQRQPFSGVPAGALQEAMNASDDMKSIMGIYDASLGARSNETSGKAIMARQREGDVATFHFIDNLSRAIRHAGRILVDLIPKVYSKPRVMRIIGEDDQPKNVQVNQPHVENGIERIYDLTTGRYDVTVSSGPSFTSRREEAVQAMTELVRSFPDAAPIVGDIIVKMMDFPDAEKISQRLKSLLPPQVAQLEQQEGQIPPEAQQIISTMQQQLQQVNQQMQQGMAEFQKMQAENQQLKASQEAEFAKMQSDAQATMRKIEADLQVAEMDNATRLEIARLQADAKASEQQFNAYFDLLKQEISGIRDEMRMSAAYRMPSRKKLTITAPSGQVYEGMAEDDMEEEED